MNKMIIILTVFIAACTSQVQTDKERNENSNNREITATEVQLNNGQKWKADETTKQNVAALVSIISDSSYANASKKGELSDAMQRKVNTLVSQCSMKGADHDALHVWLETIVKDMKDLKRGDNQYSAAYSVLKKDIANFYEFFE